MFKYIITNFGFKNSYDFISSLFHFNLLYISIPMATITAAFTYVFGITFFVGITFLSVLVIELVSGVVASRISNKPISSKKFSRFGLKVIIWFLVLAFINALRMQYSENILMFNIYYWLHNILISYVSIEYLISIFENLAIITGKSNNKLIQTLSKKLNSILGIEDEDNTTKFFNGGIKLLLVLDKDFNILRNSDTWLTTLNLTQFDLLNKNLQGFIENDLSAIELIEGKSNTMITFNTFDKPIYATMKLELVDGNYNCIIELI